MHVSLAESPERSPLDNVGVQQQQQQGVDDAVPSAEASDRTDGPMARRETPSPSLSARSGQQDDCGFVSLASTTPSRAAELLHEDSVNALSFGDGVCVPTVAEVQLVLRAAAACPALQVLSCSNCRTFDGTHLGALVSALRGPLGGRLRRLDFSGARGLTDSVLGDIVDALAGGGRCFGALETLDISSTSVTSTGVMGLCAALLRGCRLRVLSLQHLRLTARCAVAIVAVARAVPSLRAIHRAGNSCPRLTEALLEEVLLSHRNSANSTAAKPPLVLDVPQLLAASCGLTLDAFVQSYPHLAILQNGFLAGGGSNMSDPSGTPTTKVRFGESFDPFGEMKSSVSSLALMPRGLFLEQLLSDYSGMSNMQLDGLRYIVEQYTGTAAAAAASNNTTTSASTGSVSHNAVIPQGSSALAYLVRRAEQSGLATPTLKTLARAST